MTAMNAIPASSSFGLTSGLDNIVLSSLSWSKEEGERLRLTVITVLALVLFVPLAFVITAVDVPEPERETAERVPPQLAKLLVKPEPLKKPVAKPVAEVAPPKPEPKQADPEPKVVKPVIKPAPAKPKLAPKPVSQSAEQAREKASRSGLLTMKDRLASMRQPAAKAAPVIQANTGGPAEPGAREKAVPIPGENALKSSGGVKDAQAPRAEVSVAGHDVRKVEPAPQAAPSVASAPVKAAKPAAGERAMSNIRQVFDSGKTALYSLYQRELRQDPTLAGKVLLELVIQPDGSVSACKVVSSELENTALEQKIAMRVRLFNFGAANVEARKVRFPIDFLPG